MSGEKTEQPTPKKLRESRKKGQVAKSKDVTQAILTAALLAYFLINGDGLVRSFVGVILMPVDVLGLPFYQAAPALITEIVKEGVLILLPFLLIVITAGVLAEVLQVGVMFSFEAIMPSAKKLNIVQNFSNIFSKKNFVEFLKSCFKLLFLSILITLVIRDAIATLVHLPDVGIAQAFKFAGTLMRIMALNVVLAYSIVAFVDFIWQRHQFTKGLMMSKDEIKQEYKNTEGDPTVKQGRKQFHRELLAQGAVQSTRKSSAVVTNPTHIAIALLYEKDETPLPVVLAKGEGYVAQRMVEVAQEEGIVVLQNIALAHALRKDAKVSRFIPRSLIEPVAEVLKQVRRIQQGYNA